MVPNSNHPSAETITRLKALYEQKTWKCDPQFSLTRIVPTPKHGWPRIYPSSPDTLYANIPNLTLAKWLVPDTTGEKVIVQVMCQNLLAPPQCELMADLLVRSISAIFSTDKVKVATASKYIHGWSQQNIPFSFLVFGLHPTIAKQLLAKHCFATERSSS